MTREETIVRQMLRRFVEDLQGEGYTKKQIAYAAGLIGPRPINPQRRKRYSYKEDPQVPAGTSQREAGRIWGVSKDKAGRILRRRGFYR